MRRAIDPRHERARELRKFSTLSEQRLWGWLRNRTFGNYKFRRQVPIGRYILDFYCPELRLAIEVDGRQHEEIQIAERDQDRTERLAQMGIRVVRIPNELLAKDSLMVEQQIRYWIETSKKKRDEARALKRQQW
jgi:very-short-patch-repair endonuclease